MPVTGSGLSCQLFLWSSRENIIAQVQVCILFNVNLGVKHLVIFHTSQTLVEDREIITSLDKIGRLGWGALKIKAVKEIVINVFYAKVEHFI